MLFMNLKFLFLLVVFICFPLYSMESKYSDEEISRSKEALQAVMQEDIEWFGSKIIPIQKILFIHLDESLGKYENVKGYLDPIQVASYYNKLNFIKNCYKSKIIETMPVSNYVSTLRMFTNKTYNSYGSLLTLAVLGGAYDVAKFYLEELKISPLPIETKEYLPFKLGVIEMTHLLTSGNNLLLANRIYLVLKLLCEFGVDPSFSYSPKGSKESNLLLSILDTVFSKRPLGEFTVSDKQKINIVLEILHSFNYRFRTHVINEIVNFFSDLQIDQILEAQDRRFLEDQLNHYIDDNLLEGSDLFEGLCAVDLNVIDKKVKEVIADKDGRLIFNELSQHQFVPRDLRNLIFNQVDLGSIVNLMKLNKNIMMNSCENGVVGLTAPFAILVTPQRIHRIIKLLVEIGYDSEKISCNLFSLFRKKGCIEKRNVWSHESFEPQYSEEDIHRNNYIEFKNHLYFALYALALDLGLEKGPEFQRRIALGFNSLECYLLNLLNQEKVTENTHCSIL